MFDSLHGAPNVEVGQGFFVQLNTVLIIRRIAFKELHGSHGGRDGVVDEDGLIDTADKMFDISSTIDRWPSRKDSQDKSSLFVAAIGNMGMVAWRAVRPEAAGIDGIINAGLIAGFRIS